MELLRLFGIDIPVLLVRNGARFQAIIVALDIWMSNSIRSNSKGRIEHLAFENRGYTSTSEVDMRNKIQYLS
jgi:hypothetical protein